MIINTGDEGWFRKVSAPNLIIWVVLDGVRDAMGQRRNRSGSMLRKGLAVLLVASAGVLEVAATAWAEPEPNNTTATATALLVGVGGRGDGLISPAGDVDVYSFAVTAPGTYVAQLLGVASSVGPMQLQVLNPAGATINGVGCAGNLGSANICVQNEVTLGAAGTYFVRVQSLSPTGTGAYTVRVLPSRTLGLTWTADAEPNDRPSLAAPITVGSTLGVTQSIEPRNPAFVTVADDVDVYAFQVPAAGTYVAELYDVQAALGSMQLQVLNPAEGVINGVGCSAPNTSGNVCARNEVPLTGPGTYFVRVTTGTAGTVGRYSLRVLPSRTGGLTWDANSEPNDIRALAPPIGVGRTAAITRAIEPRSTAFATFADDVDVYAFTATYTGPYVVELFDVQAALGGMQVQVFNTAGTNLSGVGCSGQFRTSGNVCARNEVPLTAGSTYFVRISTGTAGTAGRYSLRVLPRFDQGLTWTTTAEPNDTVTLSSPLTLGVSQGQSIDPVPAGIATFAPDVDVLRISAVAGRSVTVTVSDLAGGLTSTGLAIKSAAGVIQTGVGFCNVTGVVCNRLTLVPAATGILALEVTSSNGATGRYNICARLTSTAACRTNTLRNPGFETDANADTRPDSWTSDARFTRSSAVAPHGGTFAGRLAATDNSTVTIAQTVGNQPFVIPYVFSGWVNIPATADTFSLALRVRWRNAANGTISVSTVRTFTAATAGWTQATATLTPPAGANNAVVELAATSLGTAIYLDDLSWTATR